MEIKPPVKAPAPKAPVAPTVEPQQVPPAKTEQTPPAEQQQQQEQPKKRKGFVQSIADAADIASGAKKEETPAALVKKEEPTAPVDKKLGKEPDDTDEGIKAEIETKTKGMDGAARQAWADLRYEQRENRRALKDMVPKTSVIDLEAQLVQVRQELATAKTASPQNVDATELESLREQLKQRDSDLMVAKVEKTEAFANAVTKPLAKVDEKVQKLAKKYDLSAVELNAALTDTSDAQSDLIESAIEKMNTLDRQNFLSLVGDVNKANESATVLRSQAAEALKTLASKTATQTDQQVAEQKLAREAAHETNWKALVESMPDVLTPFEGDEPDVLVWNEGIKKADLDAKTADFGALKPEVQSQVLQRAAVFPLMAGTIQSLKEQLADSTAAHEATKIELGKFTEKKPGGESQREGGAAETTKTGPKDSVKNANDKFARAGF